jgi:hypothetical protein
LRSGHGRIFEEKEGPVAWKSAAAEERAELVGLVTRSYPAFRRDPARCLADVLALPFYPEGRLVRLSARDVPGKTQWYVCLADRAVAMGDGMDGINACNASAPLMLNDGNIAAYLRYYLHFSAGMRLFESKVKRSSVGYTGKIWYFSDERFFEADVNVSPRGLVVELEKTELHDVPPFAAGEFDL